MPFGDAGQDLQHPLTADPAGNTFPAGFGLGKFQKELGKLHHTGIFIDHDHPAGTHYRAHFLQRVKINFHIEVLRRDTPAQRASGLNGLKALVLENSPADIKDDFAQGDSHGDLHQTGVVHLAGQSKNSGPRTTSGSDIIKPIGPVDNDLGNIGITFHIIEIGRLPPEAGSSREGGARSRFTSTALNGCQQGRFFTTDKGPGPFFDMQMKREIGVQNIISQQAILFRLGNSHREPFNGQRIFGPAVNVAFPGPDGISANGHAFDQAVRVAFQQGTVHKGPRVPFIGIADDILEISRGSGGKFPFGAGGKTGASASSQSGTFDLLDHFFLGHIK